MPSMNKGSVKRMERAQNRPRVAHHQPGTRRTIFRQVASHIILDGPCFLMPL